MKNLNYDKIIEYEKFPSEIQLLNDLELIIKSEKK